MGEDRGEIYQESDDRIENKLNHLNGTLPDHYPKRILIIHLNDRNPRIASLDALLDFFFVLLVVLVTAVGAKLLSSVRPLFAICAALKVGRV